MNLQMKSITPAETNGFLHCPICTHTVPGTVLVQGRQSKVKPGQKCPRCSASLDPAFILRLEKAA